MKKCLQIQKFDPKKDEELDDMLYPGTEESPSPQHSVSVR